GGSLGGVGAAGHAAGCVDGGLEATVSIGVGEGQIVRRVGPFRLMSFLGQGGMGSVYLAVDERSGGVAAVKFLSADRRSAGYIAGLSGEARLLSRLQHPNVVQLLEFNLDHEPPYLVLEFAASGSLRRVLRRGSFSLRQSAALVHTVAMAVHAAHQAGVLHLDLKPENILMFSRSAQGHGSPGDTGEGLPWVPKVADFGLCSSLHQLAVAGEFRPRPAGTLGWMAPELLSGESSRVGPATDVYAIGVILYELMTGLPPFRGSSELELCAQICRCEPIPPRQLFPNIPAVLNRICLRCLEKDSRKRYLSAAMLADDLAGFLGYGGWWGRLCRLGAAVALWRYRVLGVAVVLVLLLLVAGMNSGVVVSHWRPAVLSDWMKSMPALVSGQASDVRVLSDAVVRKLMEADESLQSFRRTSAVGEQSEGVQRMRETLLDGVLYRSRELLRDPVVVKFAKDHQPQALLLARLFDSAGLLEEGHPEAALSSWQAALTLADGMRVRGQLSEDLCWRGFLVARMLDERLSKLGRGDEGLGELKRAQLILRVVKSGDQPENRAFAELQRGFEDYVRLRSEGEQRGDLRQLGGL
ncbi:MAG: hypothetical protein RL215_2070, partial [Planctomycetota bacterium]